MNKPNFFIIGAPKCGTTSLATWLAAHPAVYIPPIKEPAHFADDLRVDRPSLAEYQALFSPAGGRHVALGDASTCYLFSRVAVSRILDQIAEPRFIVCLRNPIEMARSLHQQEVFGLNEDVRDFEGAWSLQEARLAGRNIPRMCREPWLLRYKARCLVGEQVERLLQQTSRERVLFLFLEHMQRDPRAAHLRVLRFLDLPDDGRVDFPVMNQAKDTRSRFLKEGVLYLARLKGSLGIKHRFGIRPILERWNTRAAPRQAMAEETKRELRNCFVNDIEKLGALINRDLSHWLV